MNHIKNLVAKASPRGMVLTVLGLITLGVAVLSVGVSYHILEPRFGAWAVPTVAALDALWVVFQATEILARNNRLRARRVMAAGLVLTLINAAIPTADLIVSDPDTFDLAMVLTPVAIVATKGAWWLTLPALGRKVSEQTSRAIAERRQEVADKLETMEADAAHRIELLEMATELERRVAEAETAYRRSVLAAQESMTRDLHEQAEATQKAITEKVLPAAVAAIALPDLDTWTPIAPALPTVRAALTPGETDSHAGQDAAPSGRHGERHGGRHADRDAAALADLAAVTGVPTPEPGEPLTDEQLDVVLRHLRYRDDPPMSYRQAVAAFRRAEFVGSEKRVRNAWAALMTKEGTAEESDKDDEEEEADV
ncbi:hypothetical protein [Streptomyces scabiei]|uniref:hypothetical protein n=1 Tax=Streptomyces scabiei TaxID=1930 RepID=UPI001B332A2D|nr:hypothetical protein [Streptomyces sp. LBUM 1483]